MTRLELLSPPAASPVVATPARPAAVSKRPRGQLELLQAKLERAIRRRTGDRVRNLAIRIQDHCVVVRGRCGSFYCKQQAGQAAIATMKIEPALCDAVVDNQIEVW